MMTTRPRSAKPVSQTAVERERLPAELSQVNLNAVGIDVGASSHFVAVSADRAEPPVQEFASFTAGQALLYYKPSSGWCLSRQP